MSGEGVAYALGLAPALVVATLALVKGTDRESSIRFGLFLTYALVATISCLVTTALSWTVQPVPYWIATTGSMFLVWLLSDFRTGLPSRFPLGIALSLVTALLITVAVGQQFLGVDFATEGADSLSIEGSFRPSSLTGSYLHYPLVVSVWGIALLQVASVAGSASVRIIAIVALVSPFVAFSRSGMLIVIASVVFYATSRKSFTKRRSLFPLIASTVGVLLIRDDVRERLLGVTDLSSAGNSERLRLWKSALEDWIDGPILVGDAMGYYTNVTATVYPEASTSVAESSLLQQLASTGLLGALLSGILLVSVWRSIPRSTAWLRAGFAGCLVQMLFYQSVEVLPFIVSLALYPSIADWCARQVHARREDTFIHDYAEGLDHLRPRRHAHA